MREGCWPVQCGHPNPCLGLPVQREMETPTHIERGVPFSFTKKQPCIYSIEQNKESISKQPSVTAAAARSANLQRTTTKASQYVLGLCPAHVS